MNPVCKYCGSELKKQDGDYIYYCLDCRTEYIQKENNIIEELI